MVEKTSFGGLTDEDFNYIRNRAVQKNYDKDDLIFSEGDRADYIYFIESGEVSVFIQKFSAKEEICTLGPGEYFGEMAALNKAKRTASVVAKTNTSLLGVEESDFFELLKTDKAIADKINLTLPRRNEELFLKEKLLDRTGIKRKNLDICIKGDPSMHDSIFLRQRHESVVDRVLPELQPVLAELLINRSIFQLFIAFNSGEIHVSSIFDPFCNDIHQVNKLIDPYYIDRHFPKISYHEKTAMLKRLYGAVAADPTFHQLTDRFKKMFNMHYESWEPITPEEISSIISHLAALRKVENFYLRNITISMTRNAIRLQHNCDGAYFMNTDQFEQFIEDAI
jgi:CRP-like cAMP-binding protein